jgi:hypothetical protein
MIAMLRPIMPYLDYALNYDFIQEELCENKANPEENCHGKCYLKKEISKTRDRGNEPILPNFENVTEDFYTVNPNGIKIGNGFNFVEALLPAHDSQLLIGYTDDLLDPPKS